MEFWTTENGNKQGPFTKEELKLKNLKRSTLVWSKGFENWKEAKNVPELTDIFDTNTPPPIPHKKETQNHTKSIYYPSKNELRFFFIWSLIHLSIVLLVSLSDNDIFSADNDLEPDLNEFWPFTSVFISEKSPDAFFNGGYKCWNTIKNEPCKYGFFAGYDWAEFFIYMTLPILVFVARRLFSFDS